MTKTDLIKQIAKEVDMSRPDVRKVIEAMEELVLEIIATEDEIEFSFAKIEGYTKPPWRVTGMYRVLESFQKNGHWSYAKVGYPKCTFTKEAKDWLAMDPKKFFEQPEHKYTTKARQFRIDNKLEEISEYADLPESKIIELCQKADKQEMGLTTKAQFGYYNRMERMKKKQREQQFLGMQKEDLDKQRAAGVPEEELVYKDYDQLINEYYEMEKERQNSYLVNHPSTDRYRKKLERNIQHVEDQE